MRYDSTVHSLLNADRDVKKTNLDWKLVRKCFFNFFVDIFKDYRDTADAVRNQQKSKKERKSFKNALSAVTTDSPRNSSSSLYPTRKFSVDRQRMLDKMVSRCNGNAGQTFLSVFVKTQAVQTLVTAHFHISDAPADLLLTISFFNESIDAKFHNMWYLRTYIIRLFLTQSLTHHLHTHTQEPSHHSSILNTFDTHLLYILNLRQQRRVHSSLLPSLDFQVFETRFLRKPCVLRTTRNRS